MNSSIGRPAGRGLSRRGVLVRFAAFSALAAPTLLARPSLARMGAQTLSYGPAELDLYQVPGGRAPFVIFVHGGGWRIGSRRHVGSKPHFINGLGWNLASVDYRKLPRHPVETQRDDVAAAVRFVRDNAAMIGGDGRRIVMMGHSAGAHLASLVAVSGIGGPVTGLIANDTEAHDVAALAQSQGGALRGLWARAFGDDPRRWSQLSPAEQINGAPPPALITWSGSRGRDKAAKVFARRLEAAGGNATLFDGSAYSHLSINQAIGDPDDTGVTQAVAAFLARFA
jgi:acetyl esterase/lipase